MTRAAQIAALLATPASAQTPPCGDLTLALSNLHERFGETLHSIGDSAAGQILTLANDETGTWTVLRVRGPLACMVASGDGFFALPQPPKGEPT